MSQLKLVNTQPALEVGEWSKWYVVKEKNRQGLQQAQIKRYRKVDGKTKWERYPAKHYRNMSSIEIDNLVKRLNATYESKRKLAKERYDFHHAFINEHSLSSFEKYLKKQTTTKGSVSYPMFVLHTYALDFFVIKNDIADPSLWHRKEDEWAEWLLDQELSTSVLKRIVSTTNRFLKFLHQKIYPEMTTPRKLEPIGRAKFAELNYQRKKSGEDEESKYIPEDIYKKIVKEFEQKAPELLPNILLCYSFGLRISETLGFSREKLLQDSLLVDEQGSRIKDGEVIRKKVKTNARRVPYWNMTAQEAWNLIKKIVPMHPNTLNKKVNKILSSFDHSSHDFRRTFITNAHRKFHWKDVQRAAGHTTHQMTMKYDQDDRGLSSNLAKLED